MKAMRMLMKVLRIDFFRTQEINRDQSKSVSCAAFEKLALEFVV
jgi:hypothetical protein